MNCEQRVTIDLVPNTTATIGVTADGITDTLDMTDPIKNTETKTHFKLNRINGSLDFWNENYVRTEAQEYLEQIPVSNIFEFGRLEDVGNVDDSLKTKAGDILYYQADPTCGPTCVGVNDKWVKLRAPEGDGTYKLTMTVEDGVPTLSWEEE